MRKNLFLDICVPILLHIVEERKEYYMKCYKIDNGSQSKLINFKNDVYIV